MAEVQSTVTYRDVEGYPGYRVGDDGSVWSCRTRQGTIGNEWKELTPSVGTHGYVKIALSVCGRRKYVRVHSLVLTAFVGPRPFKYDACHNNGIRSDNRLSNLRWDTRKGNHSDREAHGTSPRGEKSPMHKLTEVQVTQIRIRVAAGGTQRAIAREFEVCQSTIYNICKRRTWTHV